MASSSSSSSSSTIQVKWGKETVELPPELDLSVVGVSGLKRKLWEKTGVPVDRQKILCKAPKSLWKGVLKDDFDFNSTGSSYQAGVTKLQLLLMGSTVELQGPSIPTVFLEDLAEEDKAVLQEPAGLVNLGNTCYLNSVVQCLRAVPELQQSLFSAAAATSSNNNTGGGGVKAFFTRALAETYAQLNRQTTAVQPMALVQSVKLAFPQFAQTGPHGHPLQQDAEEFYSGVLAVLSEQQQLTANSSSHSHGTSSAIDDIFGMQLKETLTCDEFSSDSEATSAPAEPPVISFDLHRKLVCNIQGGSDGTAASNAINHVSEGILLGLTGKIEKRSEVLGRDALWTRQQRIAKLPVVLVIQFGRFYWKATPDSQDHAGVKCKVMKPVAFNDVLDVYDFCTPEIQAVLQRSRSAALAAEEAAIQRKLDGKEEDHNDMDTTTTTKDDTTEAAATANMNDPMDESQEAAADDDEDLQAALALSLQTENSTTAAASAVADEELAARILGPNLPRNFQGQYELFAVVTHKGRDADGGHYMAWVKANVQPQQRGDDKLGKKNATALESEKIADTDVPNEDWFVFDDDEVSPCKTEDVLKLKGGGDWHMSYLNFYRVKK